MEIWKDIEGFEGVYQISNTGRVKRLTDRLGNHIDGGHILKQNVSKRQYVTVGLSRKGKHAKTALVHRLVATAFIPNPNNYKEINHKDENKLNNNVENLEWCSREYNMSYGTARLRQGISLGLPVEQRTISGLLIAVYCSAEVAGKLTNIDPSSIHKCCKNKRQFAGGYSWSYSQNKSFT